VTSIAAQNGGSPEQAAAAPAGPVHVIAPWRPGTAHRLQELWAYRRLIPWFGKQYMLRRVRNTWLGWLWIPLRPALQLFSQTLFFHSALGAKSGDKPYFIFLAFGSAGWVLFNSMTHWSVRAMRMSSNFLKGAYAPRLPRMAAILAPALLDFFFSIIVALVSIVVYVFTRGHLYLVPSLQVLGGVLGIVLLGLWGLGLGLVTSPWSAYARDVRFSFTYVTQFWFFITPVAWSLSDAHNKQIVALATYNPITAPVLMVQHGFLDTKPPPTVSVATSVIGLTILLVIGLWSFSRFERAAVARL
jgi:ABC-type polysaccharide/polyol phosphate export permease